MKIDYIKSNNKIISVALSAISVMFAALIFMQIMSYFKLNTKARNIENIVRTIIATDNNKPDDLNKYLSPSKEIANSLKKNNFL